MTSRLTVLFGLGLLLCLTALTYLYLNVPPGFPQPLFWSPRPNHAVEVSALYRDAYGLPALAIAEDTFHRLSLTLILLSFGCYIGAVRSLRTSILPRSVQVISGLIVLVLLGMPPLFSTDVFYYAISGQIAGEFGANPYLQPPADFPHSPLLPYNHWINITTPYGPVWTLLSTAVAAGGDAPLLASLLFKLVAALSIVVTGALIWKLLCKLSPGDAAKGTLLFLWNPLVLLETVGNGHNDALMAALTVAAALLLYKRQYVIGFLALLLATLVKYLVAPALVFYFLARVRPQAGSSRERWRAAIILATLAFVLAIALWSPYWSGMQTVSSLAAESGRGTVGPIALIILLPSVLSGLSIETARMVGLVAALIALIGVVIWSLQRMWSIWRRDDVCIVEEEIRSWAYALVLIPIALPRAHPWFLIPALALFALSARNTRTATAMTYTLGGLWFIFRIGL